jgi:PadR family transcriptional regulator, regulatory protein PadR
MIPDIGNRNTQYSGKAASREILLAFWKVHILHHASEGPVHGQWIISELRRHGYEISPGTLYPLLERMGRHGWLKCLKKAGGGPRARKDYRLTPKGRQVLALVCEQVAELFREVVAD